MRAGILAISCSRLVILNQGAKRRREGPVVAADFVLAFVFSWKLVAGSR